MTFEIIAEYAVSEILSLKTKLGRKLLVVAIEGKGCSGKSSLSFILKERIIQHNCKAEVVSIDDFCNPRAVRYDKSIPESLQVYANNFDIDRFVEEILLPASANQSLQCNITTLEVQTDTYTRNVKVNLPEGGILIIEGLHILRNIFYEYVHYAIFIWISDREQLRRALSRDVTNRGVPIKDIPSKYRNRFSPSYQHFMKTDIPLDKANLFINSESIESPAIVTRDELEDILSADFRNIF